MAFLNCCRCLVKWQLKRPSRPWHCEICESIIRWPAEDPLKLVELLAELSEKKPPPAHHPPTVAPLNPATPARPRRHASPNWKQFGQKMSRKCALAARSVRTVGKSMFEVARGRRAVAPISD